MPSQDNLHDAAECLQREKAHFLIVAAYPGESHITVFGSDSDPFFKKYCLGAVKDYLKQYENE